MTTIADFDDTKMTRMRELCSRKHEQQAAFPQMEADRDTSSPSMPSPMFTPEQLESSLANKLCHAAKVLNKSLLRTKTTVPTKGHAPYSGRLSSHHFRHESEDRTRHPTHLPPLARVSCAPPSAIRGHRFSMHAGLPRPRPWC